MLYILPAVKWRKKPGAVLPQYPDTWRREPYAAGNPEGAQARKPQDPPLLSSRRSALAPDRAFLRSSAPRARARLRQSRATCKRAIETLQ
jgi:hypothetical protein